MNDTTPPGYSPGAGPSLVLLNLAPPAEATTFQLGHLGYGPAYVAGDVQVKYAGSDGDVRPAFTRLEVTFRGVERNSTGGGGVEEIELCEQTKVLWGVGAAGSSSAAAKSEEGGAFPPSSTPFKLELTPDLPACLHLAHSSLEYTLSATLFYADSSCPPLVRCSPVHLARTSPPGSLLSGSNFSAFSSPALSTTTQTISAATPVPFSVRLPRTVFRQREPIELVTRIEVPDAKLVGEGLRLRTVTAELIRTIKVAGSDRARLQLAGSDKIEEVSPTSPAQNPQVHRTVLAHSGKSARFSPTRPIVIKLVLHPPAELSCESITQSTILHTVTFSVVVTVGLVNHSLNASSSSSAPAPSLDATLTHDIFIVPDLAPSAPSSKQREAFTDAPTEPSYAPSAAPWPSAGLYDGPVPTYVADSQQDSGETAAPVASGSGVGVGLLDMAAQEQLRRNWPNSDSPPPPVTGVVGDWEEEHDGYEDFSLPATLSVRPPPPAIDDDVSPPSAGDRNGSLSLESAAAQGIVPHDGDDTPPPPADFTPAGENEAVDTPPPPMFDPYRNHPPTGGEPSIEPATPPPHIDFPLAPLPSIPAHYSSTPPPGSRAPSPADGQVQLGCPSEGLPPPYFGSASFAPAPPRSHTPPPPPHPSSRPSSLERRYDPSFPHALPPSQASSASSASNGGSRDGTDGRGAAGGREEEETEEGRPPPYESRDVELVQYGVNGRGQVVI
ncbi:hypothetical protein JCM11251_002141 [Rhodosporidiobolus azoricus]